jgi:hypothetical protein
MAKSAEPTLGLDFERSTEMMVNGRHVDPTTELSFRGERGRFRFVEHVLTPSGAEWVTVIGGSRGIRQYRSFSPDRIKTVHRIPKLRVENHPKT